MHGLLTPVYYLSRLASGAISERYRMCAGLGVDIVGNALRSWCWALSRPEFPFSSELPAWLGEVSVPRTGRRLDHAIWIVHSSRSTAISLRNSALPRLVDLRPQRAKQLTQTDFRRVPSTPTIRAYDLSLDDGGTEPDDRAQPGAFNHPLPRLDSGRSIEFVARCRHVGGCSAAAGPKPPRQRAYFTPFDAIVNR
jgi:hypothetical protein